MQDKESLLKELQRVTEKISSLIWTLNLGTMAITWSLLVTSSSTAEPFRLQVRNALPILFLSVCALVSELLQYMSAYKNNLDILNAIEQKHEKKFEYDSSAIFYRLRRFFFNAKIIFSLSASGWLLFEIGRKLV